MKSINPNKICYPIKLGLILSISLFSCTEDNPEPAAPNEPAAFVSLYHSAPDTDGLNVVVSTGQINNDPFQFQQYSDYLNFIPGERNIKFVASDIGVVALIDTTFNFNAFQNYSLFVANTFENLEAILIEDQFPIPIEGNAMVRFIHMSPDAPNIQLIANEDELFSSTGFKDASEFRPVPARMTTFELIDTEKGTRKLLLDDLRLFNRGYYNILLSGFDSPPAGNESELTVTPIRLRN